MRGLISILIVIMLAGTVTAQDSLPLYDLPDIFANPVYESSTLAYTRQGRLVVANQLAGTVGLVSPVSRTLDAEIPAGDEPVAVAVTPDNTRAISISTDGQLTVINLNDETVSAQFTLETGAVSLVVPDDQTVFIAYPDRNFVLEVDLNNGTIRRMIETPAQPYGLTMWGDFLYVTHLDSGQISLIYRPVGAVVQTLTTANNATLTPSLLIDPREGVAYLPQTHANPDSPILDNQLIPVITVIDLARFIVLDSRTINLTIADRAVSVPYDAVLNSTRTLLYITHSASNSVSVINLRTGIADGHFITGTNPQSIVFSRDNLSVYVHDTVDNTLTIVETRFFSLTDTLPLTTSTVDPLTLIGARLFYSGDDMRVSGRPNVSCAGCHLNDRFDAVDAAYLSEHISSFRGVGLDDIDLTALITYLQGR